MDQGQDKLPTDIQPDGLLLDTPDKYEPRQAINVDCASHIDVCKQVCCKLWLILSKQDVTEGIVQWNPGLPYSIAQNEDGFCVHLDHCQGCTIYAHRPLTCRTYDCRKDHRLWLDFENKILGAEAMQMLNHQKGGPMQATAPTSSFTLTIEFFAPPEGGTII